MKTLFENVISDAQIADEDGVLLLENIKNQGYVNACVGLSKQQTLVILRVSHFFQVFINWIQI